MTKKSTAILTLAIAALALALAPAAEAAGVMFIKNDRVGIGTDDPQYLLHVNKDTAGFAIMALLENNGLPGMYYNDTSRGEFWGLQPDAAGRFQITLDGSGQSEVLIEQDGDMIIAGTLTENSRRDTKENFEALDARAILAKVNDLEVVEWSYKGQAERHIGPMAEDFWASFELGRYNGIASRDIAAVTMAALQGLNEVVEEKDQEIERLSQELAELRAMVEALGNQ